MAKSGIKEAVFIILFLPLNLNSWVTAINNIPLAIESEVLRRNRYSVKDSQQVLIPCKARGKSKLEESKK